MKTLFIYPTNRNCTYERWQSNKEPSTLLYGFCELKKEGFDVNFTDTFGLRKKIIKYIFLPVEIIFYKLVGISLHFDHVFTQLSQIKKSNVIISTSDSSSIPLFILKKIGQLKKQKIVCLSVDLINRAHKTRVYSLLRNLYSEANRIIVFSKEEKRQFKNIWNFKNVEYVQFGIDAEFFSSKKEQKIMSKNNYILTIGRDRSRDYKFLFKIARLMPNLKFLAVCSEKNILGAEIPKNVKIIFNAPYLQIAECFKNSFCFLLPLHELKRASGQIAFLEAAASGLPIIASPVLSLKENYEFKESEGVYLIEKNSLKWKDKIKEIYLKKNYFKRSVPGINLLAQELKNEENL